MSPPGEAGWVVDQLRRVEGVEAGPSGTRNNNLWRILEGEVGEMDVDPALGGSEILKKQKSEISGSCPPGQLQGGQQPSLNLPMPSSHGRVSIVKLYDVKDGDIKLNDLIEVIGIVSLDPTMAAPEGDDEMGNSPSLLPSYPGCMSLLLPPCSQQPSTCCSPSSARCTSGRMSWC